MLVKVVEHWVGSGFSRGAGDQIDLPPAEAEQAIKQGWVMPVETTAVETATIQPPETAMKPSPKPRPRKSQ